MTSAPPASDRPRAARRVSVAAFWLAVIAAGGSVMVIEILGARVVGPVFGVGLFVWSSLISVTLGALALGYVAGGKAADRWPTSKLLYGALALAGLWVALLPLVSRAVLLWVMPLGLRLGPLLGALVLFGPVLGVLGTASPIAVRLCCATVERAGHAAGAVYASSTAAGVVAALYTAHGFIPSYSVDAIWVGLALVLLSVAGLGLAIAGIGRASMLPVLALAGVWAPEPVSSEEWVIVESTQSAYAKLAVVDDTSRSATLRLMRADHSVIGAQWLESGEPAFDFLHLLTALHAANPRGERLLLLGLGAGTLSASMARYGVVTDVIELDAEVVRLARQHFGFEPTGEVFVEDARTFVRRPGRSYDFIVQDTFTGGDNPEHLFSVQMLRQLRARLNESGLVVLNFVGSDQGAHAAAAQAVNNTLRHVFPHVRVFRDGPQRPDVPLNNLLFFASNAPIEFAAIDGTMFSSARHANVLRSFQEWETLHQPAPQAPLITDARNPLSQLAVPLAERFHALMNEQYPAAFWVN